MASHEAAVRALDPDLRTKDVVRWQVDASGLPPDAYPSVTRLAASMLPMDDPRVFDLGLEVLIEAIAERGRLSRPG
jgi:hypothetical protein